MTFDLDHWMTLTIGWAFRFTFKWPSP